MEYIMIGFLFAIGWHFGKGVAATLEYILGMLIKRSELYQVVADKKARHVEQTSDIKVVKNQIGFR